MSDTPVTDAAFKAINEELDRTAEPYCGQEVKEEQFEFARQLELRCAELARAVVSLRHERDYLAVKAAKYDDLCR